LKALISKLDLDEYLGELRNLFSRAKEIDMQGDINIHYQFISQLSKVQFITPPSIKELTYEINNLAKHGNLYIDEIVEFVKIIRHFIYLKSLKTEGSLLKWLDKIIIPQQIQGIIEIFDKKYNIKPNIYEELDTINFKIDKAKEQITNTLYKIVSTKKLSPYLVDRALHLINNQNTLMVRGGFNVVIKASVVGRSSSGFFYIVPDEITSLKQKLRELESIKDETLYKIRKEISTIFNAHLKFIDFINRAYDRFDHYQARVTLAKSKELEFVLPSHDNNITLKDFVHPAIKHNIVPINIEFNTKVLLLTGVNAGGKTMMLKSILSVIYLSKHLIPMKIDTNNSHIGSFKDIFAILDDPQNVKNDISTFAGRMLEFSKIFGSKNSIVGVDEIELGTDSDEAASLFKVILTHLKKESKVIVTTHHKKLASLMAKDQDVTLSAALYDEVQQKPKYQFLMGTIGKSYAFETALRYQIPSHIVKEAQIVYGEDNQNLNELIQKSATLEIELQQKIEELNSKILEVDRLKEDLHESRYKTHKNLKDHKRELDTKYYLATSQAKEAIKADKPQAHRYLNKAHKIVKDIKIATSKKHDRLDINDRVRYNNSKGKILSINKNRAYIELDNGMKLKCPIVDLIKIDNYKPPKTSPKVNIVKPNSAMMRCDIHGLRGDEAMEKLDDFISNSLIVGYDELLIYHGVGSGILSKLTKKFLASHPKVISFDDAPFSMGGSGAKLVKI